MCWVHKGQVTFSQSVILQHTIFHFISNYFHDFEKTPEAIGHCTETIQNLPLIRVRLLSVPWASSCALGSPCLPEGRIQFQLLPSSAWKPVHRLQYTREFRIFLVWDTRFSVQQVCCKQLVTWKMEGWKKKTLYVDFDRNFDMWHVQSWRSQERNILPSKDKGKSSSKVPLKGDMLVSWSTGCFQHPFNITPITALWAHDVSTSPGVCKHEPTMIRSKHLA